MSDIKMGDTITCRDRQDGEEIKRELEAEGFLVEFVNSKTLIIMREPKEA